MAQKIVTIDPVGEVVLAKRRGTRQIRLSVTARGTVRVGLPAWVPYAAGTAFARERIGWIERQLAKHLTPSLISGSRIGKSHRLILKEAAGRQNFTVKVTSTEVLVTYPADTTAARLEAKVRQGAEQALKNESRHLLPQRLQQLAAKHEFSYKDIHIRKLTSRWGSCSSQKVITLSYYLIQLPWELIDYVLIHELLHTRHMHHGPGFWSEFEKIKPGAKKLRKQVNDYKPQIVAN